MDRHSSCYARHFHRKGGRRARPGRLESSRYVVTGIVQKTDLLCHRRGVGRDKPSSSTSWWPRRLEGVLCARDKSLPCGCSGNEAKGEEREIGLKHCRWRYLRRPPPTALRSAFYCVISPLPTPQTACRGSSTCAANMRQTFGRWGRIFLLGICARMKTESSLSSKRQINSEHEDNLW